MGSKAERRAARELVAAYHEECLGELIMRVAEAVDQYRAGDLDAFELERVIHRHHRASQKLWAFCWESNSQVYIAASTIAQLRERGEAIDWWERAAPRR